MFWLSLLINSLILSTASDEVYDTYFSAMAGMERLLESENKLLMHLDYFITFEEQRLQSLKSQMEKYMADNDEATKHKINYLTNPINAFKLIKRLNVDWAYTTDIMNNDYGEVLVENLSEAITTFDIPNVEDESGAIDALIRLQKLYNLSTSDVANGKLNKIQYSSPMSSNDCFEVGHYLYEQKKYTLSIEWMLQALKKANEMILHDIDEISILEVLSLSTYYNGKLDDSVKYTKQILNIDPGHPWAQTRLNDYKILNNETYAKEVADIKLIDQEGYTLDKKIYEVYKMLCRDELQPPESVRKDLKCKYLTKNNPFLRLAPFKMEELYLDPYVAVFHEVLYDNEITLIKEAALPKLQRAGTQDAVTGGNVYSKVRTSKTGWLNDDDFTFVETLSQRTADMTGYTMDFAEPFQVANYGIGGHYLPHFDFSLKDEKNGITSDGNGNRIATVLFYMTNVAEGGATVFPELGISVKPKKGLALFWVNLHPSGEGNFASLHAACPVLRGDKWVSNKWIRERGQELVRNCTLEYQTEGMNKDYPEPIKKNAR